MKNSGFTLLEIIIVMAILGILLGIAAISGRDWLEHYRVEGQTKEMYVDLMNARVNAMQRNRVFFVTLAADPVNQYAIYEDTHTLPDGDGDLQPTQDTLVMQKTTRSPLQPHLGLGLTTFSFEKSGLVSLNGTIRFYSSVDPFSDCIKLFSTRILMGKWNQSTSKCIAQ
jgi:prepilin-type N-terminal cleavage/methylation domain-containing protein